MINSNLKKTQKVYSTRTLNMSKLKLIGYDMDHTLAMYNRENFEQLAFNETLLKFVKAGYPEEFLSFKFDPNYIQRGLLVDMDRGNLLKVDAHKYVKIAYHGHQRLSKEDRDKYYNKESFKAQELLSVDTFFALSEVQIFLEIVSYMRKNPNKIDRTYREIYTDIRKYIDLAHKDGSIKKKVGQQIEDFIIRDKHLATTLIRQLDGGKKIFLLTNSHWEYTDLIMTYLLENSHEYFASWRSFFEYIIVAANKPSFFTGQNAFLELDENNQQFKPTTKLLPNRVYQGGNAETLEDLTGFRGDSILYVGDHMFGDIKSSKDMHNWRTALIVEELETEIEKTAAQKPTHDAILVKIVEKEELDEQLQKALSNLAASRRHLTAAKTNNDTKKISRLEHDVAQLQEKANTLDADLKAKNKELKTLVQEREYAIHPIWGELMRSGLERSRFADQLRDYACIYMSRVTNLRFYSQNKLFMPVSDTLPHET